MTHPRCRELVKRLSAGEHPIRVWRAHRGMTREALAAAAGVSPSYLTEIETRRKPGSLAAMAKLATALHVPLDDIAAWLIRLTEIRTYELRFRRSAGSGMGTEAQPGAGHLIW
jgi:transcriptional regulator with XRE-family HTH domain